MGDFGAILAALLEETGVSRAELGRRLGLKDPGRQVRRWINSPTTPRWETVQEIAAALRVDPARMSAVRPLAEEAAASAPPADDGWLDPLWEDRQTPRPAADDAPDERDIASG